jgi:alpha-L-fucosidase
VARGPKRDLIADISDAVREVGIKFGVYYSGGLDWSVSTLPPITLKEHVKGIRPRDAAYAMYCHQHLIDLIDRYKPDILWNDIEYPDFGKHQGEYSLASVFDYFYSNVQDGLVNDRWCVSHSDYTTSEYQHRLEMESGEAWENCRGIGFSFGYNQVENESHYQSVESAIRHLVNIVSRGGNLLLNIGPTASGEIPDFQRVVLEGIGAWLSVNGSAIYGSEAYTDAPSSETPWIRWTQNENAVFAIIDQVGQFSFEAPLVNESSASVFWGEILSVTREGTLISMNISAPVTKGPIVVSFKK